MSHKPDEAAQQMLDTALRLLKHPHTTDAAARQILEGVYSLGVTDGTLKGMEAARPLSDAAKELTEAIGAIMQGRAPTVSTEEKTQ